MKVTQISIGRFHHFHLARQLEKHGLLECIWTGYPRFKLKDEHGIPPHKIKTFPWVQTPFMFRGKLGLDKFSWLNKEWAWQAHETLDKHVAGTLDRAGILFALSGSGLHAGAKMKSLGGKFICDRGSSHIRFQNNLLHEEYKRWGLAYKGVDPRKIEKEEQEYALADYITVPSEFVKRSFLSMGIGESRLFKIPYGARLDRFHKVTQPAAETFRVLWVGAVSIRKGFMDALEAFQHLRHPSKEFIVVGQVTDEIKKLLIGKQITGVVFKGIISNTELPYLYSSAHVFVLPSIEEGLAMVQGEALSCGCPIIATPNSGSEDLIKDGVEGFVVPIHSPRLIAEKMQVLAENGAIHQAMSDAAIRRVQDIGGWDTYGEYMSVNLNRICTNSDF